MNVAQTSFRINFETEDEGSECESSHYYRILEQRRPRASCVKIAVAPIAGSCIVIVIDFEFECRANKNMILFNYKFKMSSATSVAAALILAAANVQETGTGVLAMA